MSTTTLEIIFKVGSQPTSATSVVLSDPTGAYGVLNTDTAEVLVANGTPMVNSGTGVYRYDLTADAGTPISWFALVTYNGVAYRFEREQVTAVDSPASHYLTLADLIGVDGQTNLYTYSSLDGEPADSPNLDRIQLAMNHADARVDSHLRRYSSTGGFAVPVLTAAADFDLLKQAAAYIATAWLYGSRGARDVVDANTGQFNPMLNKANYWQSQAKRLMDQFIESACNTLPPGTFQSIDAEYDSAPRGLPVLPFGW